MILTIVSKDVLTPAQAPHKGRRFDFAGAEGFQLRKLAVRKEDGSVFGFIVGGDNAEGAFTAWRSDNQESAQIIQSQDLNQTFGENWQDQWLFAIYDWQGRVSDNPVELFEQYLGTEAKENKGKKIDRKTRELIGEGFEYPEDSGNVFSLSTQAQLKWMLLYTGKGLLTYPVIITTADGLTDLRLDTADDVTDMFTAMLTTVRGHLDSGHGLKATVRDVEAEDESDILNVADDR